MSTFQLPSALANQQARLGIVLGSGLGSFVDELKITATVPYSEIPHFPQSKVPGHEGRFIVGELHGYPLLVAQGRVHLYEGWSAKDVTAGVCLMQQAGVERLILTNAAGTVNPAYSPGSWMLISDHLNLSGTSPLIGNAHFIDLSEVYSERLRAIFRASARQQQTTLHEGVYASVLGPQYETPAEVRMLQRLGADAVGMSTVLEAIQAKALGLEVVAFSCLTNWAAGLNTQFLHHEEVMAAGKAAAGQLIHLLHDCLDAMA